MIGLTILSGLLLLIPLCTANSSRIAADLLPTYRRTIRPGAKANVTDIVKIGLSINNLVETTNPPNSMIVNGTMQLVWTDSRLAWNATKYGTIRIQLPARSIWVPKISGDVIMALDMEKAYPRNPTVEIDSSGQVHWNSPLSINFRDRTPEKNDTITGQFELYIYEFKGVAVDIQPLTGSVDHAAMDGNGDHYINRATLTRKIVHFICCPGDYPRIDVNLVVIKKVPYLSRILNTVKNWST